MLITTAVREALGLSPMDGSTVKGVDSAGPTLRQRVALPPLRIGSTLVPLREAYVTSLKVDHDIDIGKQVPKATSSWLADVQKEHGGISIK